MKTLLDFLPILFFFGAYKFYNIYFATGVLMAATVVQMAAIYAIDRKLQTMHKITLVLILLFGALTLFLQDERFIKWKPTVLYGAMSLVLIVAQIGFKKNLLQILGNAHLNLPAKVWTNLNVAWILYFILMAAANAYVVVQFSTETWVNFKLWGYAIPIVFFAGQGLYIAPHLQDDKPAA